MVNFQNGNRFETYVLEGKRGSGVIGLNGPAALLGDKGQMVSIFSYAQMTVDEARSHKTQVITVAAGNKVPD